MLARITLLSALIGSSLASPLLRRQDISSASGAASSAASGSTTTAAVVSSATAAATATASSAAPASTSSSSDYLTGLVQAISARNAPALAGLLANNSAIANALGALLSTGNNYTLIAPSDPGLNAALATIDATNTTLVTQLLQYHLIPGYYPADSLGVNATTIVDTSLSEKLVFYRNQYLTTHVVGGQNVTILANSTYQNVLIKLGDNALHLPTNISSTWQELQPNSQLLTTLASTVPGLITTLDTTDMLTVFAPSNDAISNVQAQLQSIATDPSQLQTVLAGHIVNGTVIYSNTGNPDVVGGGSVQSAAGTTLQFIANSTGAYVQSQGTTAKIIQSDIITSNGVGMPGVIHLIDAVLVPPSNATTAAGASQSVPVPASTSAASSSASAAPLVSVSSVVSASASSV